MFLYLKSIYFYVLLIFGKLNSREIEFSILDIFLKKNDTFIDVGSNIGRYCFKASKLIKNKGKIFSFEPLKSIFIIQSNIIKLSNLSNIVIFNLALSDKSKEINFKEIKTFSKKFLLINTLTRSKICNNENINNYCLNLDVFNFQKVKLIKIDCEGEEFKILKGSRITIKKFKPILIVEENKQKNKYIKFLNNFGYKAIKIKDSRNLIFVHKKDFNKFKNKLSHKRLNVSF